MLRLGLFADLHYAAGVREGTRFCSLGVEKLTRAMAAFARARVHAIIGLGDLVDSAPSTEEEAKYLADVVGVLSGGGILFHLVPGNHCIWSLDKHEYCRITRQASTWGSVDVNGWRLLLLDGCFRGDGAPYGRRNNDWTDAQVSGEQVDWLRGELQHDQSRCLVFIHQRLDVEPPYGVSNARQIRAMLEASGRVRGVFQGHEHTGAVSEIAGIRYTTLPAMVEGSSITTAAIRIVEADEAGMWRFAEQ